MGFKNIGKDDNYELPDDKWLQSHYTYVGNVFDTPEHQEALAKLETINEEIAYKEAVMAERKRKLLEEDQKQ